MVNRLEIPRIIDCFVVVFCFVLLHDWIASVLSEDEFVLSNEHENQNVATIGTG